MKINHYKWKPKHATIIVGLTGTLSGGKTTLAKYLQKLGAKVLDADKTALSQLEKGKLVYREISRKFGKQTLNSDGTINKNFLAEKIFSNPSTRKWLENLIHPYVLKEFKSTIEKTKNKIIICDIPLLFERNLDNWFDLTVCVTSKRSVRLERAQKKGWSTRQFNERMRSQLPEKEKIKRSDILIDNSGSLSELRKKAERIYKTIKTINQENKNAK
ncbi:MAG TPA: dephospho-CoA kinase [Elusimicrobiales bacterium]|nr:dephospho-CoA kinase [Elusimicrobiales bacterium]